MPIKKITSTASSVLIKRQWKKQEMKKIGSWQWNCLQHRMIRYGSDFCDIATCCVIYKTTFWIWGDFMAELWTMQTNNSLSFKFTVVLIYFRFSSDNIYQWLNTVRASNKRVKAKFSTKKKSLSWNLIVLSWELMMHIRLGLKSNAFYSRLFL